MGCSLRGQAFTPLPEAEPNDSRAAAQLSPSPVVTGDVLASDPAASVTVSIPDPTAVPVHDLFAFDHPGGAVEITPTFESAAGADLDLWVFDAGGAFLACPYADNVASGDCHEPLSGRSPPAAATPA